MSERKTEKKTKIRTALLKGALHILLVSLAVFLAIFVRARGTGVTDEQDIVDLTDETGVPYLTDMDSYYHVRLVDNFLNGTGLGNAEKDGKAWDTLRFYPEGKSAEYEPGIVMVTAFAWKVFGGSLPLLEFRIAAVIAALSAVVAYIIGYRIRGYIAGATAAVLVSCAPQFVARTCFGRFDTDMFIAVFELLFILFVIEMICAKSLKRKLIFGAAFALTQMLYSFCYNPRNAFLFAGITLAGAFLWLVARMIHKIVTEKAGIKVLLKDNDLLAFFILAVVSAVFVTVMTGGEIVRSILGAFNFYGRESEGASALPKLSSSISELAGVSFLPGRLSQIFLGYVAGEMPSIVNGVGGAGTLFAAVLGLMWLIVCCFEKTGSLLNTPGRRRASSCSFILAVWLFAALFMTNYGVRFIEHVSIPAGLLAGIFAGAVFSGIFKKIPEKKERKRKKPFPVNIVYAVIIMAITMAPSVTGARQLVSEILPSTSDSSAFAMEYVKNRSETEDAVIASWWDMGYYYENASGHPCLFDGGSQDSIRAVLISKALISDDMELSRRILLMLSSTGNKAVEILMQHTDAKNAFDSLYAALTMEKNEAADYLQKNCDLSVKDAAEVSSLLHPEKAQETYLVITYTMTCQLGWFEYFGGWDFSGTQRLPSSTYYSYTPDRTPIFNTAAGMEYLKNVRGREVMWRLFFDAESSACFTPAFEWLDGGEHVRIWKVEP